MRRRDPGYWLLWTWTRARGATRGAGIAAVALGLAGSGCGEPAVTAPPSLACFTVDDPYARPGTWLRGNFHLHTTHSDGALSAGEVVAMYGKSGYGAIAITDHNCFGDQDGGIVPGLQTDSTLHDWNGDGILHSERRHGSGVEAYVRDWARPPVAWARDDYYVRDRIAAGAGPILLSGMEGGVGGFHIGCIGHPAGSAESPGQSPRCIQRTRAAGGFVYLAHPGEWNATPYNLTQAIDLSRFHGIEIANGLRLTEAYPGPRPSLGKPPLDRAPVPGPAPAGGDAPDDCSARLPWDATPAWDGLLSRGVRLWGLANDDSHTWPGAPTAYPFTAFNVVRVGEMTPEGVLQALHAGAFYGSTGLEFTTLEARGDSLFVEAREATRIRFIGWNGVVLQETEGKRDAYGFAGDEGYVRVEATGEAVRTPWAPQAWSQPFWLRDADCAAPARGGPESWELR